MHHFIKLLIVAVLLTIAWPGWAVVATVKTGQENIQEPSPANGIPATSAQIAKVKNDNRRLAAKYKELINKDKELGLKITQIRNAKITEEGRLCSARDSLREDIADFDAGVTNDAMKSLKTRSHAKELLAELNEKIRKNRYTCLKENP